MEEEQLLIRLIDPNANNQSYHHQSSSLQAQETPPTPVAPLGVPQGGGNEGAMKKQPGTLRSSASSELRGNNNRVNRRYTNSSQNTHHHSEFNQ
jgi:hypothetical protein